MIFYYFMIIILLIQALLIFANGISKKKEKVYLTLAFIQLFLISGLRSSKIGTDTVSYIRFFKNWGIADSFWVINTRIESGFVLLNRMVYFITDNSQSILLVTSVLILYLFFRFIYKNSEMVWLSVYLFITLRFFYFTMSGIRQAIAIGIIFVAYEFVKKKRIIPFVIVVLLASLFHSTAIVFLAIYPIINRKFNRKNILLIVFLTIIVFITFNSLINIVFRILPQYKHYSSSIFFESEVLANYINFMVDFVILIFGAIIVNRNKKMSNISIVDKSNIKSKECSEINILLNIMLLSSGISFIAIRASMLDRISSYFSIFSIIFIPKVICMVENKRERVLYIYLIMIFALLYHTIIFIYRPEWNIVFPYEFFWHK